MSQSKLELLEEFNARCKACDECRLRATATQVVPGGGSAEAEIMFIGEGPGQKEDELGVPFVGRAGKFLDDLLESIDLKREDVFIANMVKCRPPGNRDPEGDEIDACRHWLDEQVELIDPKVIVPLGRFAMAKFIPKAKISNDHGKAYKVGGRIYFLMYHPAVALYNGSMREVLMDDMQLLQKIISGEFVEKQKPSTIKAKDLDEILGLEDSQEKPLPNSPNKGNNVAGDKRSMSITQIGLDL